MITQLLNWIRDRIDAKVEKIDSNPVEKFTREYLNDFYKQNRELGYRHNPFDGLTKEELNQVRQNLRLTAKDEIEGLIGDGFISEDD